VDFVFRSMTFPEDSLNSDSPVHINCAISQNACSPMMLCNIFFIPSSPKQEQTFLLEGRWPKSCSIAVVKYLTRYVVFLRVTSATVSFDSLVISRIAAKVSAIY